MTNFEKIKNMSVEEMADLIRNKGTCDICPISDDCCVGFPCKTKLIEWLQSETND